MALYKSKYKKITIMNNGNHIRHHKMIKKILIEKKHEHFFFAIDKIILRSKNYN